MKFKLSAKDIGSKARAGSLITDHGIIETPIFMPVGTQGTVKGIHTQELITDINPDIILSNTYHLYLRPGKDILKEAGGLHQFIKWNKPILTDSGGFQVYSLSGKRKISDEGVKFKSHIDGSYHFFSPEHAIRIQKDIGADIIMAFDECTPYPCEYGYAKESLNITHQWLDRCITTFNEIPQQYEHRQLLFPIVQGSVYKDLREKSAEYIASKNAPGNAIGGLSVGEPVEKMYEFTELVCNILPDNKPRYLMGVGTPENIIESIALGVDMMDCVMPTRNGRNGMLFTFEGIINIKNKKWEKDFSPLDEHGYSFVDNDYSKAYVRHLFKCDEAIGRQIASIHNLNFYLKLVRMAREHIISGTFSQWKKNLLPKLSRRL